VLHTPGDGKLKSTVYAVFGREFTAGLLPVDYTLDHVRVWGFVSKPSAARPNRRMQHFFINGRYVKSRTAMVAMEQAFKNSIMVGKFPACVLHLELNCQTIDVNVHPTKLEVRFINERPVFDAIYHGVKTALQEGDTPSVMTFPQEKKPVLPQTKPVSGVQMTLPSPPPFAEKKAPITRIVLPTGPTEMSEDAKRKMVETIAGTKPISPVSAPVLHDSGAVSSPKPWREIAP
jgi:DNA mismatch repair protein MutL